MRGKIFAPRFEMIDPPVQQIGDAAVLTLRFVSYGGSEGAVMRWNCTEVYRPTHWSFSGGQSQV